MLEALPCTRLTSRELYAVCDRIMEVLGRVVDSPLAVGGLELLRADWNALGSAHKTESAIPDT